MMRIFVLALIVSIAAQAESALPSPTAKYQHSAVLKPDEFAIYWNVTQDSKLILEVHSKLQVWLGFGFSQVDDQKDLDVFVAWSDGDGTGHFSDRHRKNGGDLLVDKRQSWFIDDVTQTSSDFLIINVHRNIKVCDPDNEDIDIKTGLMNVVFSSGLLFGEDHLKPWNMVPVDILNGASEGQCEPEPQPVVYEFQPTAYYSNFVDLIDGVYRFYWNFTDTDITGEIHCKTKGWVGFGLSPNGKMDKSDVVVGWIADDGHVNFTDRHVVGRSVLIDESQDWTLLGSKEENGFTVFKFTRKIVSCDPDDRIIEEGSPFVIYAYGASDPKPGSDVGYHGLDNRGTRQVVLISGAINKEEEVENIETYDFLVENVIIPASDTTYYCTLMRVPDSFTEKRHIVKWELLMPKLNVERIHHVLVYECPLNLMIMGNPNGHCFSNRNRQQCNTISFGWAVGSDFTHYFPPNTGYPIGGDIDYKYFYVEVHYDNPAMKLGYIDSMGLRFHMTKNLRQNELGILTVGTDSSERAITIPPGLDEYEITGHCFDRCTSQMSQEVTVILAMPHTHLVGTGLSTNIIRNGQDIGYLHQNKYYDFNFQNVYRVDPPIVLKPGDELITKCRYKTDGRQGFTFGGESTHEEMCFYFYTYYPRINNFRTCLSIPATQSLVTLFKDLAAENFTTISDLATSSDYSIIRNGYRQLRNKTSSTPGVQKVFQKFLDNTEYESYCINTFYGEALKGIQPANTFVEENVCKDVTTTTTQQPQTTTQAQTTTSRLQVTTSGSTKSIHPVRSLAIFVAISLLSKYF